MRHFFLLLITLVIAFFLLQDSHLFLKTRSGENFGYFKTETSAVLPPILARYLHNSNVRYSVYKIPNYVQDFLAYNKTFYKFYKNNDKFLIIVFTPHENIKSYGDSLKNFYDKVETLSKEYSQYFNFVVIDEVVSPSFIVKKEKIAYRDLKEYCGSFCIINPTNDTMFVFTRISNAEIEALDAVFQHYSFMKK